MLKSIFARVWATWGLISFLATFIIIFPISMLCYAMPYKKGQIYFIAVSKIWMKTWLALVGCPLTIKGREHFGTSNQNFIVAFNHNSMLDIPLSCPFVPGGNKTIAKDSFAKIPIFGWFYKRGGIMVNRKSTESRKQSFDKMKAVLRMGLHMCIYPEGTRNNTTQPLKPFFDGAFKLAESTQTSIIPCLMFNTKKAMPLDKTFYFLPTKLYMHFLPPVSVQGKSITEIKDEVYNTMLNYYTTNKV